MPTPVAAAPVGALEGATRGTILGSTWRPPSTEYGLAMEILIVLAAVLMVLLLLGAIRFGHRAVEKLTGTARTYEGIGIMLVGGVVGLVVASVMVVRSADAGGALLVGAVAGGAVVATLFALTTLEQL